MCLDTTVLVWGRKLREQDAGVLVVLNAARPKREDSKDSHWRQPLTSDSQAFVPEVDYLTSPHWACHRHPYKTRVSYNWSVEIGTKYTVVWSDLSGHTRSKKFSRLCSWAAGSIPCVASSATTWVNQPMLMDNRR